MEMDFSRTKKFYLYGTSAVLGLLYVDALTGEYTIEQRDDSTIVLHLSSTHPLSTTLNLCAGLWTEAIIQDIQSTILAIIKKRCETTVHRAAIQ